MGSAPSVLSMVRVTSARPSGGRPAVPAKMTSSILPPRNTLAPCSPITHDSASSTLDLPEPLGPTTQVIPGSKRRVVAEAKDLKPFSVRLFRCTGCGPLRSTGEWALPPAPHKGVGAGPARTTPIRLRVPAHPPQPREARLARPPGFNCCGCVPLAAGAGPVDEHLVVAVHEMQAVEVG